MTIRINNGAAWKYVDTMQIYNGSAWKDVSQAWIYTGSAWKPIIYLDAQVLTVGTNSYSAYGFYGDSVSFGALSDGTTDIYANAIIRSLYWIYDTYYGFQFLVFEVDGNVSNSGWDYFTVGGYTFYRSGASFSYDSGTNKTMWLWSTPNPFGTTVGTTLKVIWPDTTDLVTFTPAGGPSGTPVNLSDIQTDASASVTITASASVVWNWSMVNGTTGSSVSVANGGTGGSITFTVNLGPSTRYATYTVNAFDGVNTKYWTVYVEADNSGAVMTL